MLATIGVVESPFKEKFATPRQPNIVSAAKARIKIASPYNQIDAFDGLEQFSHIWLIFEFHQTVKQGWKPSVRPPRLGGNKKMGVFATRSTFRPNPFGLSCVKLEGIDCIKQQIYLNISGADLIDQTPILDIKPYIQYSDSLPHAESGFAEQVESGFDKVVLLPSALNHIEAIALTAGNAFNTADFKQFLMQTLIQDPRPAYKKLKSDDKIYGSLLSDFNIRWQVVDNTCEVLEVIFCPHAP